MDEQENSTISPKQGDRVMSIGGYLLIGSAVFCFMVIAYIKLQESFRGVKEVPRYESWLDLAQREATTISLVVIALIAASLGKSLLTSVRLADARSIPYEDLPLIKDAVIAGTPEPIDQYVRLRSLSGMSGNFTKLGITGLPLTTVLLTLIFSVIALLPLEQSANFMDLAKLTLGAFIGSFVQRQVEQRRQEATQPAGTPPRVDLVA